MNKSERVKKANMKLLIFACAFVMSFGGAIAVATYGLTTLDKKNEKISSEVQQAQDVADKIAVIKKLSLKMKEHEKISSSASTLTSDSNLYQFQNDSVDTLREYAKKANLKLVSYEFEKETSSSSGTTSSTTTTSDGASDTLVAGASSSSQASSNGIKVAKINFNINANAEYEDVLYFMHLIEHSPTRMRISNIGVSAIDRNSNKVNVSGLTVDIYVKEQNE